MGATKLGSKPNNWAWGEGVGGVAQGGDGGTRKLVTVAGGGRARECGSGTRAEGSEVERVDKMWSGRWPGLEKGERRVWGHHDTRVVGAERQIKKESTNAGKW